MSNQGWVKLHRKTQDHWIWKDKEPFDKRSAWTDLFLSANHSDTKLLFNGSLITIKRGQLLTSVRKLSEKWNWSVNRVYRFLTLLQEDGMILKDSDKDRTLLTIVNYGLYQDRENTLGNSDGYTDENSNGYEDGTPTDTTSEHIQERKRDVKEGFNNSNNGESTELPPLNLNVKKAWYGTFKEYPNKNNPTIAQRTWTQIISEYPSEEHYDVSVLIAKAIQCWKADYKVHNLNDPNGRFAKEFSEWLKDDLRFWIQEAKEQDLQKQAEKAKAAADNVGMTEEEWNSLPDYRTD